MQTMSANHDYTIEHMHTAMCAWEYVLEQFNDRTIHFLASTRPRNDWQSYQVAHGMASLRSCVAACAERIEEAWLVVGEQYPYSFDWDFVPEWMEEHRDYIIGGKPWPEFDSDVALHAVMVRFYNEKVSR
jgi:hypothetical protein